MWNSLFKDIVVGTRLQINEIERGRYEEDFYSFAWDSVFVFAFC